MSKLYFYKFQKNIFFQTFINLIIKIYRSNRKILILCEDHFSMIKVSQLLSYHINSSSISYSNKNKYSYINLQDIFIINKLNILKNKYLFNRSLILLTKSFFIHGYFFKYANIFYINYSKFHINFLKDFFININNNININNKINNIKSMRVYIQLSLYSWKRLF